MKFTTIIKMIFTITVWGASFIATKIALQELSPLAIIIFRFGLGVAVMAGILAWRRQAALLNKRDLCRMALLGLNGVTIHQLLQVYGLTTTTATNSGWIIALIPLFTAVLARFMVHESFGWVKISGFMVATAGALTILNRGNGAFKGFLTTVALGDILMLISTANWALFTAFSKRLLHKYPPTLMMTYVMTFGWLFAVPFFAAQGEWHTMFHLSLKGFLSIAFLGIACSGLAYVFWYDALMETDASNVSSFLYVQPIVTVVTAALMIGEPVTWSVLAGGPLVLSGVWLVNRKSIVQNGNTTPVPVNNYSGGKSPR